MALFKVLNNDNHHNLKPLLRDKFYQGILGATEPYKNTMNINKVTDDFAVSAQINPQDIALIAKAGYRCIINNRPDNEEHQQPSSSLIESTAKDAGIAYHYLPVVSGQFTMDDVLAYRELCLDIKTPTLAFCRSGTRCIYLWAFAVANQLPAADIILQAKNAGYDISSALSTLIQLSEKN